MWTQNSSHYESYGEEEDDEEFVKDRAHYIQWSSSQPCLRPVPESRICGYLWKKKWLGQWTRQLSLLSQQLTIGRDLNLVSFGSIPNSLTFFLHIHVL